MDNVKNLNKILKDIIQSSWNGIGVIDLANNIKFVNKAFSPVLGYKEEELLNKKFTDFMLEEYKDKFIKLLKKNIENPYINKIDIGCRRKDGKLVFLEIVVNLMSNKKHFVINATDITSEIAEKHLIDQFVLNFHLNKDRKITNASKAFLKIIDLQKEELNIFYEDILSKDLDENIKNNLKKALDEGKNWRGKLIFKKKNGANFYVEIIINPVRNKYGDITGFDAVMMDITGEILLERSKDNLQKRVIDNEEKLKIMVDTIRTVAHEWRQPLNAISLASQNLLFELEFDEDISKDTMKSILNEVQNKTQELSNVIASFQEIIEIKGSKKKRGIVDIINESFKIVELNNNECDIIEEYNTNEAIVTYPKELAKAISNVLKNAKERVCNNNGIIKIITKKENDKLIIEIINNGGQIPSEIKDKIFLPYFSTKEKRNGVGLGLYITKTIIELHLKGSIYFENIENDSVKFVITLPIGVFE